MRGSEKKKLVDRLLVTTDYFVILICSDDALYFSNSSFITYMKNYSPWTEQFGLIALSTGVILELLMIMYTFLNNKYTLFLLSRHWSQ